MDIVVGDSSSSRAKVFLLGSPCVEHNCEAVKPDTRKAIALLAYLAVTKRRHGRDTLAALLWPDYGRERAHGALRRTLSALKSVREEGWLEVDRTSARFVGEEVWVDVDRFREVLAECGAPAHALSVSPTDAATATVRSRSSVDMSRTRKTSPPALTRVSMPSE